MPSQHMWTDPFHRVVAFAGAGGTGKSTTLGELANALGKIGVSTVTHPSVTREFYALHGLSSESEYLENVTSDEERLIFQQKLMYFFIERLKQTVEKNPEAIVLCDRTAIDHFSYMVYGSQNITLQIYQDSLTFVEDHYLPLVGHIIYFPYPATFSVDIDPDPFRWTPAGKNVTVAALIQMHIRQLVCDDRVLTLTPDSSAQERGKTIVSHFLHSGALTTLKQLEERLKTKWSTES